MPSPGCARPACRASGPVLDDADVAVFTMLTNNEKSHDLGLIIDQSGTPGRLHHISYWVDSRDELLRGAGRPPAVAIPAADGRHRGR